MMANNLIHQKTTTNMFVLLSLLLCLFTGCAASDDASAQFDNNAKIGNNGINNANGSYRIEVAESSLKIHRPSQAQAQYAAILDSAYQGDSTYGQAAVGKALTDLMLLLGEDQARTLISQNLGADRGNYDVEKILWSREGVLFWFSQNTPWEDSGSYKGVRSILADSLPWQATRFESLDDFFGPLVKPTNELMDNGVLVADALAQVQLGLREAIANQSFTHFYLPYEVFHDDRLGFLLGKPALHMLDGTLSMMRASIYFAAAYDHTWSLQKLLSSAYWEAVLNDPEHAEHDASITTVDGYLVKYVNETMLRTVRDATRLETARASLKDGLNAYSMAFEQAQNMNGAPSTMRWERVDASMLKSLSSFFGALAKSVDAPTVMPDVTPTMTLNLGALFDGRVLPAELDLATADQADPMSQTLSYTVNEDAITHLTQGIVSPDPAETTFEFGFVQNSALDDFGDQLIGQWVGDLEDAYNIQ